MIRETQGGDGDVNLSRQGKGHIIRMDFAVRVFAAIALALFALTVVFIILAYYDYMHPAASLFSFMAILPTVCIAAIIRCCREPVANRYQFDLPAHDEDKKRQDLNELRQEQNKDDEEDSSETE